MNDLNFSMRQVRGVVILDLAGRIEFGEGSSELRLNLQSMIDEGKRSVIFDLGRVRSIDSYGLGTLVAAYASLEKNGGQLKLVNLSPKIVELMTMMRLHVVFEIFDNEAAAIDSFSESAGRTKQPLESHAAETVAGGSSIL